MLTGYFSSCRLCPMCSCGMYKERAERSTENHRDNSIAPGPEGFESGRCVWCICNDNMVALQATKLYFSLSSKVLMYLIAQPSLAKPALRGSKTSSRFCASSLIDLFAEKIALISVMHDFLFHHASNLAFKSHAASDHYVILTSIRRGSILLHSSVCP